MGLRGLLVIDPEGVLQGLQTGGACAADWKPDQENLKV